MRLIVGLGNPNEKYFRTRHNLGFLAIEILANSLKTKDYGKKNGWRFYQKLKSAVVRMPQALLAKPQTFVNKSGEAVKKIVNFYKIKPADILIIRDDIDLAEGKIRGPKAKTGSGGHLGIESIEKSLGGNAFYQLKIGVGRPPENLEPADFVLQKVPEGKWQLFKDLIKKEVVRKIQNWLDE